MIDQKSHKQAQSVTTDFIFCNAIGPAYYEFVRYRPKENLPETYHIDEGK